MRPEAPGVCPPNPGEEDGAWGPPADLLAVLAARAESGSLRYVYESPRADRRREMTAETLHRAAVHVGTSLRSQLEAGRSRTGSTATVCLVFGDPLDFTIGFFATLAAGLVPVPAPGHPRVQPAHRGRLTRMLRRSNPLAVLTDDRRNRAVVGEACPVLCLAEILEASATGPLEPIAPPPTAYLQYTSGSLSEPKPIAVGQRGVLAHLGAAAACYREDTLSVSVNWVPPHHDMGLVTGILRPLWSEYLSVLIDPYDFVRDPSIWPQAMSKWRATHTSAPDFGYALCARKAGSTADLDLSSLKVARSSGELVRPQTVRRFTDTMRPAGFDPAAFTPSYGLAEATLTVTSSRPETVPKTVKVRADRLRRGDVVLAAAGEESTEVTSCGTPLPDTQVRVLDERHLTPLPEARVGEIWVGGTAVHAESGNPHRIEGVLGHRTGDSAFLLDGELYLLGRSKERFQVSGENFYYADLENAAMSADDRIRPGRVAAFAARPAPGEAPVPVVAAEIGTGLEPAPSELDEIAVAVVAGLARAGLPVGDVVLVPARTLPVTTSGKVRRLACRDLFENKGVESLHTRKRGRP